MGLPASVRGCCHHRLFDKEMRWCPRALRMPQVKAKKIKGKGGKRSIFPRGPLADAFRAAMPGGSSIRYFGQSQQHEIINRHRGRAARENQRMHRGLVIHERRKGLLVVGLFATGLFWAMASTGLAQSPPPATANVLAGPSLFMAEITHDFGEVDEGVEVAHEFIVENKGNADLAISKVTPG